MKIYVLTRKVNDYNQYGEYFVAWFLTTPTVAQLQLAICEDDDSVVSDQRAEQILKGEGRQGTEFVWWQLRIVKVHP